MKQGSYTSNRRAMSRMISQNQRMSARYSRYPMTRQGTIILPSSGQSYVPRVYGNPRALLGETKIYSSELYGVALSAPTLTWAGTEMDPSAAGGPFYNGTTTPLTLFSPIQGDNYYNRTGRRVDVLKIKINGHIYCAPQSAQTAPDAPAVCRVVVVQDMQTNGAQLNAEDVMNGCQNSGTPSPYRTILGFQNPDNFGRFKVLHDEILSLQDTAIAGTSASMEQQGLLLPFKVRRTFTRPVRVNFNQTNGGTVADIVDNSFHVIAMTTSTAMAPLLTYQFRCTFKDA